MTLKYVNSQGREINLNHGGYLLQAHTLRNYRWDYSATARPSGYGGRVSRFSRPVQEKTVSLGIRGNHAQYIERMNHLFEVTEVDIMTRTPGRLYLDGQYLACYLAVSSDMAQYSRRANFAVKDLTIIAENPFWITERVQHFIGDSGDIVLEGVKKYTLRFPYRFSASFASKMLTNPYFAETPMIITIYGPCVDPTITIAGNPYSMGLTLLANERLIIDQTNKTIVKIDASGARYNEFNSRSKESDVFAPAPSGNQQIGFDGTFVFDITTIERRSEPIWT